MTKNNSQDGFSILETVVSLALFIVAILAVNSMYSMVQKAYTAGSNKSELSQNARVSIDRLSREIRQAVDFVGSLPTSTTTATTTLEFQDGHNQTDINYIKYYLDNNNLLRATKYYYFSGVPATHVHWYDLTGLGAEPLSTTTSEVIIGEYFSTLTFYNTANGLVINASLDKNKTTYNLETLLYTRN